MRGFIQTPSPRDIPVIRPSHFDSTKALKQLGLKAGVIVFTQGSFKSLKRLLKGRSFRFELGAAYSDGVAVFLTRYGSAPSCIALEQMIEAGIRRLIVFGEAGSIHPGVKIGDIVLPSWGIRGEGVSYHYLRGNVRVKPNRKVLGVLQEKLATHGLGFKTGSLEH